MRGQIHCIRLDFLNKLPLKGLPDQSDYDAVLSGTASGHRQRELIYYKPIITRTIYEKHHVHCSFQ